MRENFNSTVACLSTLVLLFPGCLQPTQIGLTPTSSEEMAIRELFRQRVDAADHGDIRRWVACFSNDAIIMPANASVVVGKEAIKAWERGFEGFRPQVKINIDEVIVAGAWAYVRSRFSGVFIKDSQRFPIEGKELAILRRVQGDWYFHRLCGNKDSGPRFENSE